MCTERVGLLAALGHGGEAEPSPARCGERYFERGVNERAAQRLERSIKNVENSVRRMGADPLSEAGKESILDAVEAPEEIRARQAMLSRFMEQFGDTLNERANEIQELRDAETPYDAKSTLGMADGAGEESAGDGALRGA